MIKFTFQAIVDDETRKQVREFVLGEARALARDIMTEQIRTEISLVLAKAINNTIRFESLIKSALQQQVASQWSTIGSFLDRLIEEKLTKAFEGKVDKLGQGQADAVRALVRKELRAILGNV